MPIYEYTCPNCDKTFEYLRRTMQDSAAPACPECGSAETRRALSVFAVAGGDTSKSGRESQPPSCGRCGGAPGSCMS